LALDGIECLDGNSGTFTAKKYLLVPKWLKDWVCPAPVWMVRKK